MNSDVEDRISIVCINRHVHRVENRVDAARLISLGMRERVAHGISILHPDQAPVADDQVWIMIEEEERRDTLDAVLNQTSKQNPAGSSHVVADQQLEVAEVPGK